MRPADKIENAVRKMSFKAGPEMNTDIWAETAKARNESRKTMLAPSQHNIGRIIMKSKITKFAAAAAIAIMVLLPLSYGAAKLIRGFISIRQLSTINQDFTWGALSPDGKYFAGITGGLGLVVIDTSTGQQRKLAENCDYCDYPVWSADGSEIAVVSSNGGKNTIIAVSLKTGKTRTLMEDPPWYLGDWSSDGKLISFRRSSQSGVDSEVMVNLETKQETILVEDTGGSKPISRFSPKADLVSYVTKEGDRYTLHLRKVDGTSHVEYSDFPGVIFYPLWSPDGAYVVFRGTQIGLDQQYQDLWALRVQGNKFVGAPFPVVSGVEKMVFYNWAQNGQLAYRTGFQLGGIFTLPVDLQTGKATGAPRQLVRVGGTDQCYCWSPDGKQIAVWQDKKRELSFISAGSGAKMRDLSVPEIAHGSLSCSPDGKIIARGGIDKEKRAGLFLITVETGEVKLLLTLETPALRPTWSPDGKTIAYGYKADVYIANVEDGKPRRLTSPTEPNEGKRTQFFIRPVFAPDGRSVAYIDGRRILSTTIDGEETREILNFKNEINVFDWSPDGRYIVFTPGNKEIWCAATDGGEPFQIADISNLGEGKGVVAWWPEWSPKGDEIIFRVVREEYQYWVMENFLPVE